MEWLKTHLSKVIQWVIIKWLSIPPPVRAQIDAYKNWGFLTLIGLPILFLILWKVPEWQVREYQGRFDANAISKLTPQELIQLQKDLITAENNTRTTLAQIIGGLVVLLGLYAAFKNVRVTEEGKLTERFSKAVELLGSDKLDIRLGGIYALERIARDSLRDHWTVMEVLTAFIREQSRRAYKGYIPNPNETSPSVDVIEDDFMLREDIQVTLTVIGRRKWSDREFPHQEINLMQAFLGRAVLFEANLKNANLFKANLTQSILYKADLRKAMLADAVLIGANLSYANLSEANLDLAELHGADLRTSIGLTLEQLSKAVITSKTMIPPELEEHRNAKQAKKAAAPNK
jgi:hypothetical protein